MSTKILLVGFAIFSLLMLFGCNNPNPPVTNGTNQTIPQNQTQNQTPITIIVGNQTNQTTQANQTKPPVVVPPVNETNLSAIEYIYDPSQPLGMYFIDVGQPGLHGNAILIKKGDFDMLLDAGPSESAGKVKDFLTARGVNNIDVLVSTNADPRNYGGISTVADNFAIQQLWWNGDARGDSAYSALVNRLNGSVKKTLVIDEGFTMDLDGIHFEVLNPAETRFFDINNDAIVMKVSDRNTSILLTSSIQTGPQGRLINDKTINLSSTIMEAPYFGVGAGTSNINFFLLSAKPKDMIITGSSDESATNGGSRDPFKRQMKQYNITWHEVYANGTVRVMVDENGYSIQSLGVGQ